ncbi:methylated-DNA--[protein]-cysteine S-methyltransferase [Christensenellaceae bacterium OttesenSCG-928-M15]|nr:methylated-DNA--[protein]-cysteine S-methyltransferase [Christensenellaceae bacterium OttesenSCG-928-M15]
MPKELKSQFYRQIYETVAMIPPGSVATYGQIAAIAGSPRAARQVGYAMSAASKERRLPCHRVVNRLGELAPEHAFGGKEYQRMLLEMEGVTFLGDGRIHLKKHIWGGLDMKEGSL